MGNGQLWTRERWERAAAELTQAQTAWQHANVLNRVGDALDALAVYAAEADRLA